MKLVKCNDCGKYIYREAECYNCGSKDFIDVDNLPIHDNVVVEYEKLAELLRNKKFNEVIDGLYGVFKWMPSLPSLFIYKMLAKNKCVTISELIKKGVKIDSDPDFLNALDVALGIEYEAISTIKEFTLKAQKLLIKELEAEELKKKVDTNIKEVYKKSTENIKEKIDELISMSNKLADVELILTKVELDCYLLTKEHVDSLKETLQQSKNINEQLSNITECTFENFHAYDVILGNMLLRSESAKATLANMQSRHPWVKEYSDLKKLRDELVSDISNKMSLLKSDRNSSEFLLRQIEEIEERYQRAIFNVNLFEFESAKLLLEKVKFDKIFNECRI